MGSGGMKRLIVALALIAAGYTGFVIYLAYIWSDELVKMRADDFVTLALYCVPILAVRVSCIALWRVTKSQP